MKQLHFTFFYVFFLIILLGCEKPKVTTKNVVEKNATYNQKANELIVQEMIHNNSDHGCNCILEISIDDNSKFPDSIQLELKQNLMKMLELKKGENIDSIIKVANTFTWDKELLKKNNIKVIKYDTSVGRSVNADRIFKTCPGNIYSIQRPIFDKHYKNAVMVRGLPFTCSSAMRVKYKFKSGKWVSE